LGSGRWPTGPTGPKPRCSSRSLLFQIKQGAYNTESLICFLTDLHEHLAAANVTLIRDGLSAHKSAAMKAWLAEPEQRRWLVTEMLPGHAHDLNPIEMVWGNIKQIDLANLCPDTIDEAQAAAEAGLDRVGADHELCMAFLAHTSLSL
jgi:transposase